LTSPPILNGFSSGTLLWLPLLLLAPLLLAVLPLAGVGGCCDCCARASAASASNAMAIALDVRYLPITVSSVPSRVFVTGRGGRHARTRIN
jgi:hypothetical protein